jgi:hypothetical protein
MVALLRCAMLAAATLATSTPLLAQSPEDLACNDYKRLLTLSAAQAKATAGAYVGKALQGEQYHTSLGVGGYQPCALYVTNSSGKQVALSCEATLPSNELALLFVQSSIACLKPHLENIEVTQKLDNGREWATKVKGQYPYGRFSGGAPTDFTSIQVYKLLDFSPNVGLLVYYLHD